MNPSPATTSAWRTTVNTTVVGYVTWIIAKVFGLEISTDDLAYIIPIIGVVMGIGYRISRLATSKWPTLGYVLFGTTVEPTRMINTKG